MGEFDDVRISFIFAGDYENYPIGGTLYFLKCLLGYWNLGKVFLYGSKRKGDKFKKIMFINNKKYTKYGLYNHKNKKSAFTPERVKCMYSIFMNKHFITNNSDVLYFHAPELVYPFLNDKLIKVHHLHGYHNPVEYSRFRFLRNKFFINMYQRFIYIPSLKVPDVVIPTNEESLNKFKLINNKPILDFYIPICVDISKFNISNRKIGDKLTVLYVGRLSKIKGVDLLLKALHHIIYNIHVNNIHLYIAGDGEEYTKLRTMSKKLGISKHITFLGYVKYDDLPAIYQIADVFVLPTLGEGFSMVKLEAMASGLPVVISDTSTAKGIVDGYNGYIFKKRDPKVVAELILKAGENKDYLGKNARETVEKYYSAEVITRRIENVIKYAITKDEAYLEMARNPSQP